MKDCPNCEGTGTMETEDEEGNFVPMECTECEGTGEVESDE